MFIIFALLWLILTIVWPVMLIIKLIQKKPKKPVLYVFIASAICFVLMLVTAGSQDKSESSSSQEQTVATQAPAEQIAESTPDEADVSTEEPEPEEDNMIDFETRNLHVVYDHYTIDYPAGDNPYITVYYQFTNNSDSTFTFCYTFDAKAFQNGVELNDSIFYTTEETRLASSEIKPGVTVTVALAYRLQDESDVELDISPYIDLNDKIYDSMTISIEI